MDLNMNSKALQSAIARTKPSFCSFLDLPATQTRIVQGTKNNKRSSFSPQIEKNDHTSALRGDFLFLFVTNAYMTLSNCVHEQSPLKKEKTAAKMK